MLDDLLDAVANLSGLSHAESAAFGYRKNPMRAQRPLSSPASDPTATVVLSEAAYDEYLQTLAKMGLLSGDERVMHAVAEAAERIAKAGLLRGPHSGD